MTPEGKISAYFRKKAKECGAEIRKCRWEGRAGAPDWVVFYSGSTYFVELKAPGEKPRPLQLKEHEIMREAGGCLVYILDSKEKVEFFFNGI